MKQTMNVIINNFPEKAYNILRDTLIRGREIKIIKMKDIRDSRYCWK